MTLILDYLFSGVDFSLPGNGGPECLNFISVRRRLCETVLAIGLSAAAFFVGKRCHQPPPRASDLRRLQPHPPDRYPPARIFLLVAMTFAYALEVGYKLATKQVIFVLNPCHQLCLIQIVLLAWPASSSFITYLYRIHLFYLHGPINAVFFPVTNTLFLPGEVFTYWLEHALLLIVPFYLLRRGGNFYTVEPLKDLSWVLLSYGLWGFYHFIFLELLAVSSLANLNSILCPAISDPFYGSNWRLWALAHQFVLILASGKLFGLLGVKEKKVLNMMVEK